MPDVNSSEVLTAGIRSTFAKTWQPARDSIITSLADLVEFVPSDKLTELYAAFESPPHPARWPRGEPRPTSGFDSFGWNISNVDWTDGVSWHKNDVADDQTRSLEAQARAAGLNFGQLHERIIFQMLLNATDANLLELVPNAPDGNALFLSTTRFGDAGGNVVTGDGTTVGNIQTNFFEAVIRVQNFQDTEGQPLWNPSIVGNSVTIIYGVGQEENFARAFIADLTHSVLATDSGAALDNLIRKRGFNIALVSTPRITDNDWYVNFAGVNVKPFIIQERQGLNEEVEIMSNSDNARRTKQEGVFWDARYGYGFNLPYGLIKVDNS